MAFLHSNKTLIATEIKLVQYVHMWAQACRGERPHIGDLPLSPSALLIEPWSLTESGALCLSWTGWPQAPWIYLSTPTAPRAGLTDAAVLRVFWVPDTGAHAGQWALCSYSPLPTQHWALLCISLINEINHVLYIFIGHLYIFFEEMSKAFEYFLIKVFGFFCWVIGILCVLWILIS